MSTATNIGIFNNVESLSEQEAIVFPMPNLCLIIGIFLCLLSAIMLLYVKDLNRRLYIEYQQMQKVSVRLTTEQEKLLLEESAWSTAMHVQRIAQNQLGMEFPDTKNVVMVKI